MLIDLIEREEPPPVCSFRARRQLLIAYAVVFLMLAVGGASVCWMQYQIEILAERAAAEGR